MNFEELAVKAEKTVYFTCYDMMGNREDALDCMQETMLKAFRSFSTLHEHDPEHFMPWVRRVAVNACIDQIRKRKKTVSLEQMTEKGLEIPLELPGPFECLEAGERRDALRMAMQKLEENARAMVIFRDVQGLSYDEIADILGVPLGTVKSRIFRAREKLAKLLSLNMELFSSDPV